MNILVTVGTTPFDSLVSFLDELLFGGYDAIFQTGRKGILPQHHLGFRFCDKISPYYKEADVVITHAGAGSIYELLSLQKKCIIVPNLERHDKHQKEIAEFMHDHKYAISCFCFKEISPALEQIHSAELIPFTPTPFLFSTPFRTIIKEQYQ